MSTQDSRIKIKRSTVSATVPTVAPSTDHTQPSPAWSATDIYKGELFINQADNAVWSRGDDGVFCLSGSASLDISSAQVLALNTTPLTIVPAVSGYAIELVSIVASLDYNSAAYATNINLMLITDTAANPQAKCNTLLDETTDAAYRFTMFTPTTGTQLIANKALTVTVATGDPTAGDSPIKVFVNYRLIPV